MRKTIFLTITLLALCSFSKAQPCGAGQTEVVVTIIPDQFPGETTWEVKDQGGSVLASGGSTGQTFCVSSSLCLTFTIFDSFGDGIRCAYGTGSYTVTYGGNQVASGGAFTYLESTQFGNCPPGSSCTFPIVLAGPGSYTAPVADTWYSFTPSVTGQYYVHTCSSTCNTKIWVYDYCQGLNWDDTQIGTIYYNDDNCGVQSEVFPQFASGTEYWIRIGDNNNNCGANSIAWTLVYQGPVSGCMDTTACNYNPLATVSDTCIYPGNPNCPQGPDLMVVQSEIETSLFLSQTSASNCQVQEQCLTGYGTRDILNFTTHIKNIGTEDYYIGSPAANPGQFTFDACHGHYHYVGYAEYLLYDTLGQSIPAGFKNGFCVLDLECSGGGTYQYGCGNMGISAGCGDIYGAGLDCQWVDLTDVPDGRYTLVVRVNWDQSPDALGRIETDYSNNWAQVCIRIQRNPTLSFTIEPTCPTYVDCNGVPFGSAQLDCNGNCDGGALIGDYDQDTVYETSDAQNYVDAIIASTISAAPCTDVNDDGIISVTDAAWINYCELYGDDHIHAGGQHHDHCDFPTPDIVNTNDTVTLSIGTVDFVNSFIDVQITNPDNKVVAFEFEMSGLVIDSVASLIPAGDYPAEMSWSSAGKVIGISYLDSTVDKHTTASDLVRIFYSGISSNLICIDHITDVVNQDYENPVTVIGGSCVNSVSIDPAAGAGNGVIVQPNPFFESAVVDFNAAGAVYSMELVDITGKVVRRIREINGGHLVIQRENLPAGVYLMRLSGPVDYTAKLVIQ